MDRGDGFEDDRSRRTVRRTRKISEVIAREIVHDIVDNDLESGSRLPSEAVMLEQYDVGRASLREALRILEVHGLIRIRPGPGGGPVVAGVDSREFGKMATLYLLVSRATFGELVEARLTMEPAMARLVAERGGADAHAVLKATMEEMHEALENRLDDQYLRASTDFHAVVSGMSGNSVLDLFARSLKDIFTERVSAIVFTHEERVRVAQDHEEISAAIIAGRGEEAERLMRDHMRVYAEKVTEAFPGLLNEVVDWR